MPRLPAGTTALLTFIVLLGCAESSDTGDAATPDTVAGAGGADTAPGRIADRGFATPESVVHDEVADVYLVSNINGEPLGRDDNGFIARVRPDGTVETLKWIDGERDDVTLNAPKGLALLGDTLFVADIDSVRAFHRTSGAPLGARGVPGAAFLNDLAVGPDGALYVSDTGVDASFTSIGRDAVYRFDAAAATAVASGTDLAAPNGVVVTDEGIVVVSFGGRAVVRVTPDSPARDTIATLPAGQLDGVIRTGDGAYVVSSWESSAIYRIAPDGSVTTLAEGLEAPADIGFDARRERVLVPLFSANAIEVVPLQ